jgi:hypothetical protein
MAVRSLRPAGPHSARTSCVRPPILTLDLNIIGKAQGEGSKAPPLRAFRLGLVVEPSLGALPSSGPRHPGWSPSPPTRWHWRVRGGQFACDRIGPASRISAGAPAMHRPTSGSSQLIRFEVAVAIIVHQPMEPSAWETSSTARKTTSGGSSGPPIERGRYICRSRPRPTPRPWRSARAEASRSPPGQRVRAGPGLELRRSRPLRPASAWKV